ncbi:MAG: hypothetical protein R3240_00075 [Gammaproteobacteria bacterium]|nr:hypothetical protein [Gammaproteobacteria bacterium]
MPKLTVKFIHTYGDIKEAKSICLYEVHSPGVHVTQEEVEEQLPVLLPEIEYFSSNEDERNNNPDHTSEAAKIIGYVWHGEFKHFTVEQTIIHHNE